MNLLEQETQHDLFENCNDYTEIFHRRLSQSILFFMVNGIFINSNHILSYTNFIQSFHYIFQLLLLLHSSFVGVLFMVSLIKF